VRVLLCLFFAYGHDDRLRTQWQSTVTTVLTFDDDFDGTSGSGLGGLKGLHRFLQLEPKTF
jgi:hypothetical protein